MKIFYYLIFSSLFVVVSIFTKPVYATSVGTPLNTFTPNHLQKDFINVQSSKTLEKNKLKLNYYIDYSKETLPSLESASSRNDSATYSHFIISYGLTNWWDVAVSLPFIIQQSIDTEQDLAQFSNNGLVEIRALSKLKLVSTSKTGLALIGHYGLNRTQRLPFLGQDPGPSYTLELTVDRELSNRWLMALNLGYKLYDSGSNFTNFTAFTPLKSSLLSSLGLRYNINSRWQGISEIWSAKHKMTENNTSQNKLSIEALLGLRYKFSLSKKLDDLGVTAGLTKGFNDGFSSPDLRFFAGINYKFGFTNTTPNNSVPREKAPLQKKTLPPKAPESDSDTAANKTLEPKKLETVESDEAIEAISENPEESNVLTINNENKEILDDLKPKQFEDISFENINFYFNSYKITQDSVPVLKELIKHLNKKSYNTLEIWGHTDSVGPSMYNERLSLYRSIAIYKFLIDNGIPEEKLFYDGWGERRPVAPNNTPENRYKNRRVEFIIRR